MQDQNKSSLKKAFEEELHKLESESILSPEYKRKKTIIWLVRTILAIVLFVVFWEYQWVRWALIIYIPLNLASLFMIHGMSSILNRKIETARNKIAQIYQLEMSEEE